jgi:GNAT superfamily N-acetyltransferase
VPTVRRATEHDLDALMSLWRDLEDAQGPLRVFPMSDDAGARIEASFRDAFARDDADVLLVLEGGEPLGMALVHIENPSRMSAEVAVELSRVVVRAGRRGEGIGSLLVEAAAAWARGHGITRLVAAVFVANEASRAFWRAEGFEPWVERMIRPV